VMPREHQSMQRTSPDIETTAFLPVPAALVGSWVGRGRGSVCGDDGHASMAAA
jgi:hypothetical protein